MRLVDCNLIISNKISAVGCQSICIGTIKSKKVFSTLA